ncbi:MAG: GNAT family N-acetyltransferase [Anaerolineae bacterium]|nr:GNAT family N-acetyltransferase [Anaerolineae bacterium]
MELVFAPMDREAALDILTWRYPPPYDVYGLDVDPAQREGNVTYMVDPAKRFYAMRRGELVVAFCSFGADAQVPGGEYGGESLDIGLGLRPELTGQGHGHIYVSAVVDFACEAFGPRSLRVTVAENNRRAFRVWRNAGFEPFARFAGPDGKTVYLTMVRAVAGETAHSAVP